MKRLGICIAMTIAMTSSSYGVPLTFSDEATFLAAASPVTLESFESLTLAVASNPPTDVGPFTVSSNNHYGITASLYKGMHPTDGTNYLRAFHPEGSTTLPSVLTFSFDTPVLSFGVNITDFGESPVIDAQLTFGNDLGQEVVIDETIVSPPNPDGNAMFFGFIGDAPFSTVTITAISGDGVGYDEIYFQSVPEPSSIAMATLGLLGLGVLIWRRR